MSATEFTEKVEPVLTTMVEPKETLLREKPLDETKPKPKTRIHWQAPFFIVGGFVLVAVLAVTHHFVYKSWDYDVVAEDDQQTRYLRIGMVFAFLIETALGAAIGTTFTQVMWQLFRQKSFTVGGIDTVWTSLGNPMSLLSWEFLTKGWLLVLIAICAWDLPVISIITQATLSIRLMESVTVSSLPVPYMNSSWAGLFAEFQPASSRLPLRHIQGSTCPPKKKPGAKFSFSEFFNSGHPASEVARMFVSSMKIEPEPSMKPVSSERVTSIIACAALFCPSDRL